MCQVKKTIIEFVPYHEKNKMPVFNINYSDLFSRAFPEITRISSLLSDGEVVRMQADEKSIKQIASLVAIGTTGLVVLGGAVKIAVQCMNDQPLCVKQI